MKILKINSLKKGWCDRNEILLHASFQILVDFVEKEIPGEKLDWNWNKEHKQAWKEIQYLYNWWINVRPNREDPIHAKGLKIPPIKTKKIPGTDFCEWLPTDKVKYADWEVAVEESGKLDIQWAKEDHKNLHRLVDVREYLWT